MKTALLSLQLTNYTRSDFMSLTNKDESKKIVLGSGEIYVTKWDGKTIPEDATLETESNRLGHISGGATFTYSSESYTAQDDMGKVKKIITTSETGTLAFGICTFNGATLSKLCKTARSTEASGRRKTKIGGISVADETSYIFRFYHHDTVDGDVRLTVVGKNSADLEIAFKKDTETVLNPEITAEPFDDEGTLALYDEEIPTE